ncbi:MAG TPA: molecular chaperone TorD family protein [Methylibium sp.]|uniref:TorD/DmsD family molecular chaperone n=1 Tax=Methylibium sp. TaxID=2067992 RepID=UPI002DBD476F|nr:molecular chaperone TorD family protein [Methylibium sp.]HEU4459853.1 molecular chaperone TorD family protein [Methylibium sp.]
MSEAAANVKLIDRDEGEELQRAELYGLLARLWIAPPDAELLARFAVAVTEAPQPGGFLEAPWQALVAAMRASSVEAAAAEHDTLFSGVGKPDIFLLGSFHLAGALNEKPLVALREDLAALGLARDAQAADRGLTEDHVAFLFEVMRYLIAGDDLAVCNLERQRQLFRTHLQPWVGTALADAVEQHPRAKLYAALAGFTRAFMQVETQGFDMIE